MNTTLFISLAGLIILSSCYVLLKRNSWGDGAATREGFLDSGVPAGSVASLYPTDMTDMSITPVRYRNMGQQQYIYYELVKMFKRMTDDSGTKRGLSNTIYNKYQPATITPFVANELTEITDKILEWVRTRSKYMLVRTHYTDYNVIHQYQADNGDVQYKYEVFVHEPIEHFGFLLKIDVIKYVGGASGTSAGGGLATCASVTTPAFPTYPGGYPKTYQEIPLPSHVMATGNAVILSATGGPGSGVNIRDPLPIKSLHINSIRIENSTLVLNAGQIEGQLGQGAPLRGIQNTTLDASPYHGADTAGCQWTAKEINKWPMVPGEAEHSPGWKDCPMSDFKWSRDGVQYTPATPCDGMRDSRVQQPFVPEYNPTVATLPRNRDTYAWLMDITRGDLTHRAGA